MNLRTSDETTDKGPTLDANAPSRLSDHGTTRDAVSAETRHDADLLTPAGGGGSLGMDQAYVI